MKKNLFRKFLALFLTGTMLAGVGCKDYDDDIDDLKGQINDLKGQVELKADADRKSTRLNSSHTDSSRMPSSA